MQAKARIYRPARSAMQSGRARTRQWLLEFERDAPMTPDPLMGWNTMADTLGQIRLAFKTKEEAVAYATAKGLDYELIEPEKAKIPPKAYAENFSFNRRTAFDHRAQEE
ncbi:MAG: ETC complex I subunit [Alphaproteobacteria bacterium]